MRPVELAANDRAGKACPATPPPKMPLGKKVVTVFWAEGAFREVKLGLQEVQRRSANVSTFVTHCNWTLLPIPGRGLNRYILSQKC